MTNTIYPGFLFFPSSNLCGHFERKAFQFFNHFYLLMPYAHIYSIALYISVT